MFGKNDDWDEDLLIIEKQYGSTLSEKLSDLVDEGKIPEVMVIINTLK